MAPPRHIDNPFFHNADEGAKLVDAAWLRSKIVEVVGMILEGYRANHEAGPYVGPSGVMLALWKAKVAIPDLDVNEPIAALRAEIPQAPSRAHAYLTGNIGDLAVISTVYGTDVTPELRPIARRFGEPTTQKDDRHSDELFVGRAGLLAANMWLKNHRKPVLENDVIGEVVDVLFKKGHEIGKPLGLTLVYEYHGKQYLGVAHGLAGVLTILLNYRSLFKTGEQSHISDMVNWLMSLEEEGHWESQLVNVLHDREYFLVHWCHGSPGMVHLFCYMYKLYNNHECLEAALNGGEYVWKWGLLRKGPSLCHGIAGNAYAFLALWQLTKDQKWLDRAKCFTYCMMEESIRAQQRTPDNPFSLFEGWAGSLYFLTDMLNPSLAEFPLFPTHVAQ